MTEMTSDALAAYAGFQPAIAPPQPTRGARVIRLMLRQPLGTMGAIVLLVMLFAAVFAPYLSPYDPTAGDPAALYKPPGARGGRGAGAGGRGGRARQGAGAT